MFKMSQSELAPEEDQGIVLSQVVGSPTATSDQMQTYAQQVFDVAHSDCPSTSRCSRSPACRRSTRASAACCSRTGATARAARTRSSSTCRTRWNKIAGARVAAFQFPPLPGSSGLPIQFVITTTEPFENLNTRGAAGGGQGAGKALGQVLLRRRRPEARRAAGHGRSGSRQDRRAGHDAAGRRPGARRGAGRRLRQLLLHRGPLVQGDPAGAAGGPPEPVERAGLLHQDAQRRPDPGQHRRLA